MGKKSARYVCKSCQGGWRAWNRKTQRWWGGIFVEYPEDLIDELNGLKRPERLTEICRKSKNPK